MNSSKPSPVPNPPEEIDPVRRRTSSQALRAYREKQESFEENTMSQLRELEERAVRFETKRRKPYKTPIPREDPPTDPPPEEPKP